MKLLDVLNIMNTTEAEGDRNIKLKEFRSDGEGRILCDMKLKDLISYIEDHDNLTTGMVGVYVNTHSIRKWLVVEILVDTTRDDERDLPDYNKGKIIIIQ